MIVLLIIGVSILILSYYYIVERHSCKKATKIRDKEGEAEVEQEVKKEIEREIEGEMKRDTKIEQKRDLGIEVINSTKIQDKEKYNIVTKMKNELTGKEFMALKELYDMCLQKQESFEEGLKENTRIFMVYDMDGKIIGQAAILLLDTHDFWGAFSKIKNLNLDMNSVILYNVCIDKQYRNRGIGKNLLESVHEWAKMNKRANIVLFVDPKNSQAIRLYQNLNYSNDKSFYSPNGGEIMMRTGLDSFRGI